MFRKTRLFTPGPTPLLPAAQFAMAAADMHHRTPEFKALFLKVVGQLKTFMNTQNDVIILSSSGTGAMESTVANLTSPGDKVLVLTAGKFGERWTGIAKAYGLAVDELKARCAATAANGQGEMKGKIVRFAHLGFFDYMDTIAMLGALEHIAKDTLKLPVEFGSAVAAAQRIYAEAAKG